MGICDDLIKKEIGPNCDYPYVMGLESNAVIINRQDIDMGASVSDATRKNIIQQLVLKPGKKGYAAYNPGKNPFTGSNVTLEEGTYVNTYAKTFALIVLDHGPEVCGDIIDGLGNGEFVVVFKNKFKGEEGKAEYEIYGYHQGLRAATLTREVYSEEVNGGWAITLTETKAPISGMFMFNEDSSTTEQQFEALKAEAV